MQPDKRKYAALLARKSPPSPLARDCLLAFVFGGAICTVGEGVRMFWLSRRSGYRRHRRRDRHHHGDPRRAADLSAPVRQARKARRRRHDRPHPPASRTPIVSPAIEYKSEGLILGLGAKLFVIAGPVLVYGITASVLYGLVLLVLKGGGAG